MRTNRDRRGRGARGPLAWPRVPAMQSRKEVFDDLVLAAADRMERHLGNRYAGTEFAVEEVPPSDPAPWEDNSVLLGRLFAPQPGLPARIVLYRQPIEARCHDALERTDLVHDVVLEHVAALLGVAAEDLVEE